MTENEMKIKYAGAIMSVLHAIAHLLGWNRGQVITRLDSDGNVWVAFQCSTCGKISGRSICNRKNEHIDVRPPNG